MAVTMRRAYVATFAIMAGMLIFSGESAGAATAHAGRVELLSATSPCATSPVVTTSAAQFGSIASTTVDESVFASSPSPSASASATPSATPSASTAPSATPSDSPTPTDPPSATPTPTPSQTATPTPSQSATPTPSKSATPTPSSSPKPKTPQLCVQVKPFSSSGVHPGATASYRILVWSRQAQSQTASVTVSVGSAANVAAPKFTVCPQAKNDVCTVGDLLTSQSEVLVAGARVTDAASVGEKVTLTATVKASKATSFHAQATISVVAPSTPTPTITSGGAGDSLPGVTLPDIPDGGLTSPSNPSGLFPTVSPASSSGGKGRRGHNAPGATTTAAILPINTRLIGGQLVGLIVLAGAITIAIARLSLRTARPHDDGGGSTSA
jgi:hypothetical protein